MKVLLLSGANTVHTPRWANGLVAAGISVVCASQHEFMSFAWDERVERVRLPHSPKWGYLVNGRCVARLFAERGCDLLNAHYATGYGLLAKRSGVRPRVLSVWGSDVYDFPDKSPLHRQLVRSTLRSADLVTSTSHVMAQQVERVLHPLRPSTPLVITPFGVDTSRFAPVQAVDATPGQPLVIGTVKKLERKYGIDTLIHAFARLAPPEGGVPPELCLVGEGAQRSELQALTAELGVTQRVHFAGAIPHVQVPERLRSFDIFVAASRLDSESFGVAVIEASACGLPVVVTRTGGLPEVVREDETGLIVERENPSELAQALQRLLGDAGLRARLGQAGRRHVQANYEWAVCVQRMIGSYERALRAARVDAPIAGLQ
jgi:glycosyltransferase involved in cell wall biosynthesis